MARVLVVDDDNSETMRLGFALTAKGHEVELATDGRAAIDVALRCRPEILVVDWMLKGLPDGITVTTAIRAFQPETHAILVTGFPSRDVRSAALKACLFGYFKKPVELDLLHSAVEKALETSPLAVGLKVGYLELGPSQTVSWLNSPAREMLGLRPDVQPELTQLTDILTYRSLVEIQTPKQAWYKITTKSDPPRSFHATTLEGSDDRTRVLLLPWDDDRAREHSAIRALHSSKPSSVPSKAKRILVVDEDRLQRKLASGQLKNLECPFHSTESYGRGLDILRSDPEIGWVIIDYGTSEIGIEDIVREYRTARPDVRFIGTSTAYRKREFESMGVSSFLLKPFVSTTLASLLCD